VTERKDFRTLREKQGQRPALSDTGKQNAVLRFFVAMPRNRPKGEKDGKLCFPIKGTFFRLTAALDRVS